MENNDKEISFLTKIEIMIKYKKIEESINGSTSNIYNYNKNELLKIFNLHRESEKEKYELFSSINLNNITLPKKLAIIRNKLYGYIMDKKEGQVLSNINKDIKLLELINDLNKISNEIKKLSDNNIIMVDLHEENVLYNDINKNMNIIDIDEYFIGASKSKEEILYNNLKYFYTLLLKIINNKYDKYYYYLLDFITNEITKNEPIIIFNKLINDLENRTNNKILTIKDFNDNSKKIVF